MECQYIKFQEEKIKIDEVIPHFLKNANFVETAESDLRKFKWNASDHQFFM